MRTRSLLALLLALAAAAPARAAEPPTEPILRIETGMHTARIKRIATDAAGRWLVTASDDKTARVWELPSGRLARVLRPPIGAGNEGKLYAVAMSPDGATVACGGWTGWDWDRTHSIYFFDRESGALRRRLAGLPNVIFDLAWSPDGRFLAAALGGKNGIRVFNAATGALAGEDADYADRSCGVAFAPDGRLAATCLDGFLRLYDAGFRRAAKEKAPGGTRPSKLAFSPDGARLAVGYDDTTRVDVVSGADLSPLFAADTAGVDNGDLSEVAWSADGQTLYAGGRYWAGGMFPIRRWPGGGRGAPADTPACADTVVDILPLPGGGVAFGAADPAFGTLDAGGQRALHVGPPIADHRGLLEGFLLGTEGASAQFGYAVWGKSPARFSLAGRLLQPDPAPDAALRPPLLAAPGVTVSDWEDTTAPKLNGAALALEQYETSRSLALAPDGESFLLGTEWSLRRFDRTGKEIWRVPVPEVVWAVNVAANGRVAAAAFGDGTIRWVRVSDGKEILAFFPHADRKRWVLWTPAGYYDCSPGGEELIGWHVNRGRDQAADFFPASRFRDTYYRPDVLAKVLQTLDEAEALRLANAETGRRRQEVAVVDALPPVVTVVSPSDGSEVAASPVTLRYTARAPADAPVTGLRVLVDGRPVEAGKGVVVRPTGEAQEVGVPVPPRDCEVALIAENRHAASVPAVLRLRWKGAPPDEAFVIKPKLYVLAVGISAYDDEEMRLLFAAKDAGDLASAFRRQEGGLYRQVEVRVLTDGGATKGDILDGLEWIQRQTTSKDVAAVFFSGHGYRDENEFYYFCPADFDAERVRRTGIPWSEIKATVEALPGKALFFIDTCHAGSAVGRRKGGDQDLTGLVNELARVESGAVVFASCTGRQVSLEHPDWNNGAFTKALVEGLDGKADYTKKGRITINMLDLYLSERVKELTGGRQTPTTTKPETIADFPLAMVR